MRVTIKFDNLHPILTGLVKTSFKIDVRTGFVTGLARKYKFFLKMIKLFRNLVSGSQK
jgi:hypothetical protein